MAENSFKQLEKENAAHFEDHDQKIKENINHSIGFFHFISDIIDLFIPKVVGIFLSISGGKGPAENEQGTRSTEEDDIHPRYPNTSK